MLFAVWDVGIVVFVDRDCKIVDLIGVILIR